MWRDRNGQQLQINTNLKVSKPKTHIKIKKTLCILAKIGSITTVSSPKKFMLTGNRYYFLFY